MPTGLRRNGLRISRPVPISSEPGWLHRHPQRVVSVSCCLAFQRQHDSESGADAKFAFYMDLPLMGFDNRLGLKHTNAQSFFLRRAERPEKRMLDKLLTHSASVVTHGQGYPFTLSGRLHRDPAIHVDRIACVEKEVRKHALKLLSIGQYLWDLIKFCYQFVVQCPIQGRESFGDDEIEIQLSRLDAQLMAQGVHAVDKIIDPTGCTPDSTECVLPEGGIVEVCRQILQHEAKG